MIRRIAGFLEAQLADLTEPLRAECAHFARAVRGEEPLRVTGEDGAAVVRVLEAAQRSLARGGAPVSLEAR